MKIVNLKIENVKRIEALDITPQDAVVIGGDNGQGKTSLIDSIAYAICGKRIVPADPIRQGEKSGSVEVDLGDYTIKRTFTRSRSGGQIVITNKDGFKAPSPQALLDKLKADITFDPGQFMSLGKAEKIAMLQRLTGVDLSDIEARERAEKEKRRDIGRSLSEMSTELKSMSTDFDIDAVPDEPVSVATIVSEIDQREKANRDLEAEQRRKVADADNTAQASRLALQTAESDLKTESVEIESLKSEIEKKKAELDAMETDLTERQSRLDSLEKQCSECRASVERDEHFAVVVRKDAENVEYHDVLALKQQILDAESINEAVRKKEAITKLKNKIEATKIEAEKIKDGLKGFDKERQSIFEKAKMPIDGLSFDSSELYFNGVPSEQWSTSEAAIISVKMGMALNPELKILLIRSGSEFDMNNLDTVIKECNLNGYQVWIERVSKGDECSVIIHEGKIAENRIK